MAKKKALPKTLCSRLATISQFCTRLSTTTSQVSVLILLCSKSVYFDPLPISLIVILGYKRGSNALNNKVVVYLVSNSDLKHLLDAISQEIWSC